MKNHFFISYSGNKRQEVENIYNTLKLRGVKIIIEPYCGTSALSFYIANKHPKKYKYILNDIDDNLIKLYTIAKDNEKLKVLENTINDMILNIDKIKYLEILKQKTFESYIIKNKIYSIRPGLFPNDYKHKNINLCNVPIIKFLQTENIEITNEDAITCYKKYKDDKNNLIFLDPPYLASCNDMYTDKQNTNIYEFLFNNCIKNEKSNIILCLENNWIIKLLFKNNEHLTYEKKYEMSKRKTEHIIISNRKINHAPTVALGSTTTTGDSLINGTAVLKLEPSSQY